MTAVAAVSATPGIDNIAPGVFLIDEAVFKNATIHPEKYVGGTRAIAVKKNDTIVGFALTGISGYMDAIGLQNNDILIAINGHTLNNAKNVSLAIAAVVQSTQFRLDILRNETSRALYYRLR